MYYPPRTVQGVVPISSLQVELRASQPATANLNQNRPPSPDSAMIALDNIMIELILKKNVKIGYLNLNIEGE